MGKPLRICLVTAPITKAGITPVSNLVGILSNIAKKLHFITGNEGETVCREHKEVHSVLVNYQPKKTFHARAIGYVNLQVRIACQMIRLRKKVDLFVFFMAEKLFLPVLIGRVLRKRVILSLAGSSPTIAKSKGSLWRLTALLEIANYAVAEKILVYSPNLIEEWGLGKYKAKILIAHEHFLDLDRLKILKPLGDRDCIVGYVGRIGEEKGVMSFAKAIPSILSMRDDAIFLIIGEGPLETRIMQYMNDNMLNAKVHFAGWVSHDDLPAYFNDLKLVVIPSYTEGLPNVMLEAMACGAPVLATPVGAVPDIIKNGETGFVMENNSPECITNNVVRALNHSSLETITRNARSLVEEKFTFQAAVDDYNTALGNI